MIAPAPMEMKVMGMKQRATTPLKPLRFNFTTQELSSDWLEKRLKK
jgi:hypothetical protein